MKRIAMAVLLVAASAGMASAQSIGVYADLGSASCNISAVPYVPVNFYINVVGAGAVVPAGVNGAEFQVLHSIGPADAVLTPTANPGANVALGNPMAGGANIAFPACQLGPSINLYTVQLVVLNGAAVTDVTLGVGAHSSPSNINFQCALINKCDPPIFTALCVGGGDGFINSTNDCDLAVEDRTWGEVKNLYN